MIFWLHRRSLIAQQETETFCYGHPGYIAVPLCEYSHIQSAVKIRRVEPVLHRKRIKDMASENWTVTSF